MSSSAQALAKLLTSLKIEAFDHDPGATTAKIASPDGGTTPRYKDLNLITHFAVLVKPNIVAAGGLTLVEIVVSATADFAAVNVIKDSGVVAADSLDDYVVLEASAEEVAGRAAVDGVAYRYIAARLTMATATDEATVVYLTSPRFHYDGLSATLIN